MAKLRAITYRDPNSAAEASHSTLPPHGNEPRTTAIANQEEAILTSLYARALLIEIAREHDHSGYQSDFRYVTQAIVLWQGGAHQKINLAAFSEAYAAHYGGILADLVRADSRFSRTELQLELLNNIRLAKALSDRATRTNDIKMKQQALTIWNKIFASIKAVLGEIPPPKTR